MFPRIKSFNKKNKRYKYLVISESVWDKKKGSITKEIANIGNVDKFSTSDIENIIDGLIKIFKLESYCRSDDVEIIESLDHGSIIFWQKIWDAIGLTKIIKELVRKKNKKVKLEVEKYIQMMVINRCVNPMSKLGMTRWLETTSYKEMKGFSDLNFDVNYFYRCMDYIIPVKDDIERELFHRLRNLFSATVKFTFYDITSTFFYTDRCDIGSNGFSRDSRPDKEQIVIGVVTSYEGYPIKTYVFQGNTKDETTVSEVVEKLKKEFHIEETIFVGDRGMITKLNLQLLVDKGYDYIMGVKLHQDEKCALIFSEIKQTKEAFNECEEYKNLKLSEHIIEIKKFILWKIKEILKEKELSFADIKFNIIEDEIEKLTNKSKLESKDIRQMLRNVVKNIDSKTCTKIFLLFKRHIGKFEDKLRYIVCLNPEIKELSGRNRKARIKQLTEELDKLFSVKNPKKDMVKLEKSLNKIFEGYRSKYIKFFIIKREENTNKAVGFKTDINLIKDEELKDGIFILLTSRTDLEAKKVVESYKNLKEVESLNYDLKNFVDVRPVRHTLVVRVRAHVFICVLPLLLKRIFEIDYLKNKSVTNSLEEIAKVKLVKYKVKFSKNENRDRVMPKVTNVTEAQKKIFNLIGIKNPMSLVNYL